MIGSRVGRTNVFYGVAVITILWAVIFALLARDAPSKRAPGTLAAMLKVLTTERLAWALASFYFLTFGGFVAFSIYLPSLLHDEFKITAADAGFRTAGFVILATLLRPVGGILSDRIGQTASAVREFFPESSWAPSPSRCFFPGNRPCRSP